MTTPSGGLSRWRWWWLTGGGLIGLVSDRQAKGEEGLELPSESGGTRQSQQPARRLQHRVSSELARDHCDTVKGTRFHAERLPKGGSLWLGR